jgi:DNA-binding NtrC family response regulator
MCLVIAAMLRNQGACVMKAESVDRAKEAMQSVWFDLIIVDIHMPGESGYGLLSFANSVETPVIVMSGALDSYLAQGFAGKLSKPFDSSELMEAVMEAVPPRSQH